MLAQTGRRSDIIEAARSVTTAKSNTVQLERLTGPSTIALTFVGNLLCCALDSPQRPDLTKGGVRRQTIA